jgi:hypothetical protein
VKRRLNPWIAGSSLALGLVGAWLGWLVTDLSCRADQPSGGPGCPVWSASIAVLCFFGAAMGMAIVLAMTSRSIAEYRQSKEPPAFSLQPPATSPPTEVGGGNHRPQADGEGGNPPPRSSVP